MKMKMKKLAPIVIMSVALLASSCAKNESEKVLGAQTPAQQVQESSPAAKPATDGLSAEIWNGKLNQLLTLEMAASASGYTASEAKEKYNQVLKNPETHSVKYSWKKGREGTIKNPVTKLDMTIPVDDSVELSWVRDTTLEKFKANYHTPTEQELANADAAIDKKLGEMQDENKISADQSQAAKGMASSLAEGLSFDEVSGVGDYAVWNNKAKELKVFYRGMEFQVRVDVSNDDAVNRQKSIEIAQAIIKEKLSA